MIKCGKCGCIIKEARFIGTWFKCECGTMNYVSRPNTSKGK